MNLLRAYNRRFPIYYYGDVSVRLSSMGELNFETEIVAQNLLVPWSMDMSEDGTIYVTLRNGSIRIIRNNELLAEPLITLEAPFVSQGEGGLLGIALDKDFSQNHYIYIFYSFRKGGQLYNRVVRLVEANDKAVMDKILLDYLPGNQIHNGGRIKIGPDNKLYITTGDAGNRDAASDLNSLAGKILRINLDGSIPSDNPFGDSPIYSYGHRNPQGLAWNGDIMYASEHGQIAYDEINLIVPGGYYGWPYVEGGEIGENLNVIPPMVHSGNATWAPSGIAYVDNEFWTNKLLVACLRSSQLLMLSLSDDGTYVSSIDYLFQNQFGRLRDVFYGRDGSIYLLTNNRDGRGSPNLFVDDRIIRITPSYTR